MIPERPHADLQVIVLAAGKGTRMQSRLPKVLHPVLGRPMLDYVLHAVEELLPRGITVVIGPDGQAIREHVGNPRGLTWVVQEERLGTAHAVLQCAESCKGVKDVLILCGDTPLLRGETLQYLVDLHRETHADVSMLTAVVEQPTGYGRVIRDENGTLLHIVEEKDANEDQRRIREVSSGIFCARAEILFELLKNVGNANAQGEYYLPDILPLARERGLSVHACKMERPLEMQGINDRIQLAQVESVLQKEIIESWQRQGVTVQQPETVRIEWGVRIGVDTVIAPGCILSGTTHIGDNCRIGPYAILEDCRLEDGVAILAFTHMEGAEVAQGARVGPFARLRPGACLDEDVRIGNFVEVKQSVIGKASKINHLSYIGDATIGQECNIGAGTITCNYDGANKHETHIGDDVFIGSDTKLIAPVRIGDHATIGAGSIITRDVPEEGLTLSKRSDQIHVPHWRRPRKQG